MARTGTSHFMLALGAAFLAIFSVTQLLLHLGPAVRPSFLTGFFPQWKEESSRYSADDYLLGVGKADITGPVVEINLMGYADPEQLGTGLRQRLYSRAFIVGSLEAREERVVYLVLDTQSGDAAVRNGILEGLTDMGTEYAVYGKNNVAVTGTHSHSGPGAWLNYLLPQITSKGFDQQSYQAIIDGALLSIQRAHESLSPGRLSYGSTEIEDANINRSLFAYLANPAEERAKYEHNVDKEMTLLKFHRLSDQKDIGILTWFPVHGTSMLGNNTLITGDNKGVAAYLFERFIRERRGHDFVAGFSQANVGDTSPNVLGAFCESGKDAGKQCRLEDSTCGGRNEPCHGRGPHYGLDDGGTKSCYEIGRRQFEGAQKLFQAMGGSQKYITTLSGPVGAFHTYRDFSHFTFAQPNGSFVTTCPASMGFSFAAGTTDGPGAFDFRQNNTGKGNGNPLWTAVRNFLHEPSEEQIACHAPKPILLDVGETTSPYLWSPNIVDIQLLRVGQLIIIVSPGEATTMAGRRWKAAISQAANDQRTPDSPPPLVVLGGPANTYTHYITTEHEYNVQRYEGASTLYGPHTLNAYINLTVSLLPALFPPPHGHGQRLDPGPGPSPPIYTNDSLSFITPVLRDSAGLTHSFGDVLEDVTPPREKIYKRGEAVQAIFVGANPRNDLRLEGTYVAVEQVHRGDDDAELLLPRRERGSAKNKSPPFTPYATDADWDLHFTWKRTSTVLGTSTVTVVWETSERVQPGLYRLWYSGDAKTSLFESRRDEGEGDGQVREKSGELTWFEGYSGVFQVG